MISETPVSVEEPVVPEVPASVEEAIVPEAPVSVEEPAAPDALPLRPRFCPNCGAEADEHDRFCNKCGQSLA